jgi:hypothetical protein
MKQEIKKTLIKKLGHVSNEEKFEALLAMVSEGAESLSDIEISDPRFGSGAIVTVKNKRDYYYCNHHHISGFNMGELSYRDLPYGKKIEVVV